MMCLHFKADSIKIKSLPVVDFNSYSQRPWIIIWIKGKKPGELEVLLMRGDHHLQLVTAS